MWVFTGCALLSLTWHYGDAFLDYFRQRRQAIAEDRKLLDFELPKDAPVFRGSLGNYVAKDVVMPQKGGYSGDPSDICFRLAPPEVSHYLQLNATTAPWGWIAFAHGRSRPDQELRLVIVIIRPASWTAHTAGILAEGYVFRPVTFRNPPLFLKRTSTTVTMARDYTQGSRLTLFTGQPDPTDPSRFTIRYQTPQGSRSIIGQLQNDDTILWSVQ